MTPATAAALARDWTLPELLAGTPLEKVLGHEVEGSSVAVTPDRYDFGSPATGGLLRVRGVRPDGEPWSAFVKVLQHVRHWPVIDFLPPQAVQDFVSMFPWREELGLWRPELLSRLPEGLRAPRLLRVVELGDDRVAVWTEEVDVDDSDWDDARFARAAYLLGRFNAAMSAPEVLAGAAFPPEFALGKWVDHGIPHQGLGPLEDDDLWASLDAGLRQDLRAAAPLVPEVMSHFGTLRHGMPHGDASPQNLLVPRDDEADFVVIDINFQAPAPLGSDLSQLVVGLAHAGSIAADRLPAIEAAVLSAYSEGLAAEGLDVPADDVAYAYAGSLLLRSGFTAIPYDRVGDEDAAAEVASRLALTRFILDSAARLR